MTSPPTWASTIHADPRGRRAAVLAWPALLGAPAGIATGLGLLGRLWWPPDIFVHFQVQYALWLALCILALLALGRRRWAALLAVPLAVNLAWIVPLFVRPPSTGADEEPSSTLHLMLFNVHMTNRRFDDVARYIDANNADIVAVQETDQAWVEALERGTPHYRIAAAAPRDDRHGLALLIRQDAEMLVVRDVRTVALTPGSQDPPGIEAHLTWDGLPLAILTLHPSTPLNPFQPTLRDRQLAAAAEWARAQTEPVVILGDLNATPWSASFGRLLKAGGLVSSQVGWGTAPTWPALLPWMLRIPIDHCLHSPALKTSDRLIGPSLGSDHHALRVALTWRSSYLQR